MLYFRFRLYHVIFLNRKNLSCHCPPHPRLLDYVKKIVHIGSRRSLPPWVVFYKQLPHLLLSPYLCPLFNKYISQLHFLACKAFVIFFLFITTPFFPLSLKKSHWKTFISHNFTANFPGKNKLPKYTSLNLKKFSNI